MHINAITKNSIDNSNINTIADGFSYETEYGRKITLHMRSENQYTHTHKKLRMYNRNNNQ